MTKMLSDTARSTLSPTALSSVLLSLYPKPASSHFQRKERRPITFLLLAVIVLLPTYQCNPAIEDEIHAHRHHHEQARLHRVIRNNVEKKNETDSITRLNICNDANYLEKWEDFMKSLSMEHEDFDSDDDAPTTKSPAGFQEVYGRTVERLRQNSPNNKQDFRENEDSVEPMSMGNGESNGNWQPHYSLVQESKTQTHNFRFLDKPFVGCSLEMSSTVLHWHSSGDLNFTTNDTSFVLSNLSLTSNDGQLVWYEQNGEQHVYDRNDYCVWKYSRDWATFKICSPRCSEQRPCSAVVNKCCPPLEVIDEGTRGCKPTSPAWRPTFYMTAGDSETSVNDRELAYVSITYVNSFPNCSNKYIINEDPKNNFKLLLNGTLVHIEKDSRTYINSEDFCIDGLFYKTKTDDDVYKGSEWDQIVIACKPNSYEIQLKERRIQFYAILNFISALFLLLTDIVYILIWRHQNNIHSWLQFSYATSLLFTFSTFAVVQIWSDELLKISFSLCKIMGWITHFTYLSAFFWLTSMNFDLWWRFSRPLRSTRLQTNDKKRKRFLLFAAFSTITPLMISLIGIALDYHYSDQLLKPPIIIPGFGKQRCYFENIHSQIPYLYFPAGVLLLIDFIFFASTVMHLRKMHTHTELARTQSTSTMEDKKGVRVIAKLFVVMGVLWLFELLSWICRLIFTDPYSELVLIYIFAPMDCLNSIQGVFIFFIFIYKPNVRNQLRSLFRRDDGTKTCTSAPQTNSLPSSEL